MITSEHLVQTAGAGAAHRGPRGLGHINWPKITSSYHVFRHGCLLSLSSQKHQHVTKHSCIYLNCCEISTVTVQRYGPVLSQSHTLCHQTQQTPAQQNVWTHSQPQQCHFSDVYSEYSIQAKSIFRCFLYKHWFLAYAEGYICTEILFHELYSVNKDFWTPSPPGEREKQSPVSLLFIWLCFPSVYLTGSLTCEP